MTSQQTSLHVPSIILLATSILIAAGGQYLFKFGAIRSSASEAPFWMMPLQAELLAGFAAYMLSAVLYVIALRHIPLSIAYPSIAMGYVLVMVISHFFFGETIGLFKIVGISLISVGVLLLWK